MCLIVYLLQSHISQQTLKEFSKKMADNPSCPLTRKAIWCQSPVEKEAGLGARQLSGSACGTIRAIGAGATDPF